MSWMTTPGVRGALTSTTVAVAFAGVAVLGVEVPANAAPYAQDDPACEMLGWRHPLCAGGAFDSPVDFDPSQQIEDFEARLITLRDGTGAANPLRGPNKRAAAASGRCC